MAVKLDALFYRQTHLTQRLFGESMGALPDGYASIEWDECWVALTWKSPPNVEHPAGEPLRFISKDAARI